MANNLGFPDLGVEIAGPVAIVEMRRAPGNFLDNVLVSRIAATYEAAR